jgi:hypothetical protein
MHLIELNPLSSLLTFVAGLVLQLERNLLLQIFVSLNKQPSHFHWTFVLTQNTRLYTA